MEQEVTEKTETAELCGDLLNRGGGRCRAVCCAVVVQTFPSVEGSKATR